MPIIGQTVTTVTFTVKCNHCGNVLDRHCADHATAKRVAEAEEWLNVEADDWWCPGCLEEISEVVP